MKKLAEFDLAYVTVEVVEVDKIVDDDGSDLDGYWDPDNNRIIISAEQPPSNLDGTILHERLHAISDWYGLGLEEIEILILENELMRKVKKCDTSEPSGLH